MTVTKKDLTDNLVDHLGLSQRDGKCLVEAFFNQIRATLAKGEDVKLSGFGNFTIRHKRPRPGRNPRTGEAVPITARRVVTFKASPKLKEVCLGSSKEE